MTIAETAVDAGWPAGAVHHAAMAGGVLRPGLVARSSGELADVRELTRADLAPEELGWALSGVNRWGARARKQRRHYPVAAHLLHTASIGLFLQHPSAYPADACAPAPGWLWLALLLHDGPEAYLGDPPSPLGAMPEFAGVKALLTRAERQLESAYNLPPGALESPLVKRADRAAAVVEAHALVLGSEAWAAPLDSLGLPDYLLQPTRAMTPEELAETWAAEVRMAYFSHAGRGWKP